MSKIRRIIWFVNVSVLFLVIASCTNVKDKSNQDGTDSDSVDVHKAGVESVLFLLPSPGEILLRFYSSDFEYKQELLNPASNKDKYIGSQAQSLNLGVYVTDMAYSALFERSAETVNYLEAIQALNTETGISSGIFESLITRSKANAGQLDSLANISNEAFTLMLEFLESGGKEIPIALISSGAYIESLYLALQSIEKYSENSETIELLAEMKYPMENLIEKAKVILKSDEDKAILNQLLQISDIFNGLDTNPSKIVITKNENGGVTIGGGDQKKISEASFNILKSKVAEIRNNVVSF